MTTTNSIKVKPRRRWLANLKPEKQRERMEQSPLHKLWGRQTTNRWTLHSCGTDLRRHNGPSKRNTVGAGRWHGMVPARHRAIGVPEITAESRIVVKDYTVSRYDFRRDRSRSRPVGETAMHADVFDMNEVMHRRWGKPIPQFNSRRGHVLGPIRGARRELARYLLPRQARRVGRARWGQRACERRPTRLESEPIGGPARRPRPRPWEHGARHSARSLVPPYEVRIFRHGKNPSSC